MSTTTRQLTELERAVRRARHVVRNPTANPGLAPVVKGNGYGLTEFDRREDVAAGQADMIAALVARRDAVLAIHRPVPGLFPPACQACREHEDFTVWPCDTAAALGYKLGGAS